MKSENKRKFDRSPRLVVAAMMAITGSVQFFAFLFEENGGIYQSTLAEIPLELILRYIGAMAMGGALAGVLFAGLFGRNGFFGWPVAVLGGTVSTMIAGTFGSAIGLLPDILVRGWSTADLIPIAFGTLMIPLSFINWPLMLLTWLILIALTHLWARSVRQRF